MFGLNLTMNNQIDRDMRKCIHILFFPTKNVNPISSYW